MNSSDRSRTRVAIVAASMRIIGGHSVQAQGMLDGWADDSDIDAWLVPIDPLPWKPLRPLLSIRFVRTAITALCYWPLLARELCRADVVHVFSASYASFLLAPLPAVLVAKALRRPVILNYHSGEAADHLRRSWIARFVMRHCIDALVVPSTFLRDVFAAVGLNAAVVPNAIDTTRFAYRPRDPIRPRILSTRNFEPHYDVACTLRAFARLQARHPDASLTLVGGGSQTAALRALAGDLRLRNVTFAGRVDPSQIHRYYADADLYVQTPSIDNMPLSLLEAFASGLPVVSTRAGGVPAMLTDGVHGLLAPPHDDEAVAARLMALIDEPEYARGLAAAARDTCAACEWPAVAPQWRAVYGSLAAPASDSPLARLRSMSRNEIVWRARGLLRTQSQRLMARLRPPRWDRRALVDALADRAMDDAMRRAIDAGAWHEVHDALVRLLDSRPSRFLLDPAAADTLTAAVRARWPSAPADAAARADRLLDGRSDILGYTDLRVAPPGGRIDWHADPVHHRRAPLTFCTDVPYLSPAIGDHKIIWEINRHQDWLAFGRALWLTGDTRYSDAIVDRLESWLEANPPLAGINWASMLEIGLRTISWTWALHFLMAPGTRSRPAETPWLVDMLVGIDRQLTHVEQNLSRYFSPNTHLLGEALALYVVGLALPELRKSDRWVERGRRILLQELDRQVHGDGGHAEASMHYHRYALDMYLHAWLAAARAGDADAMPRFADGVMRMAEFARACADDRGRLPLVGDDDGGMMWPFNGRACRDVRDSLALAAVAGGRPDLAPWGIPEEAVWIGGRLASERADAIDAARDPSATPPSRTFPDTGYVVARGRTGDHAVFDVGRHGFMNAGHAHADALAVTLTLANRPLLVDAGTSTYVMDRALRDRMRDTASHNTLTIDDRPQAIPGGPFRWRTRTDARLHDSRHNAMFDWAEASHDAYAPLRHRRTMLRTVSGWLMADEVLGSGRHTANGYWHFDPEWAVRLEAPGRLHAIHADGTNAWLVSDADTISVHRGDEPSGLGWCAPVYGRLIPACAAQVTRRAAAPLSVVTWIGTNDEAPVLARLAAPDGAIAARLAMGNRIAIFLLRPERPAASHAAEVDTVGYDTDARVLHYATDAGTLRALDLVDATYARARDAAGLSLIADAPIADLHLAIDGVTLDLRASSIPPRTRIEGGALATLRAVRLNGLEHALPFVDWREREIVIECEQWTQAGAPLAFARVAERHLSSSEETLCRQGSETRHSQFSSSLSSP